MLRTTLLAASVAVLPSFTLAEAEHSALRTDLARVIVGEADGSQADWAAILWVIKHRADDAGISLTEAMQYSVVLRGLNPRAQEILTLGTAAPNYGVLPRARRRQWHEALAFVDAWLKGRIGDPCPEARDWDQREAEAPKRLRRVHCGATKNAFYAPVQEAS